MSIRQLCLVALMACTSTTFAQSSPPGDSPWRLGQVLQSARNNLDVRLARDVAAAAKADVQSADHAPLPVLTAKASQMDLQNGLGGGSWVNRKRVDKSLGLDWTWERGNKRELRTLSAQRAADAAQSDVEDMQLQQLQAGLNGFYDLLAAQERLSEIGAIGQSMSQLASTAARRVQAGDLAAQDAARIEIEAQRAQSDVQLAELDRQRAAAALNQVLGLSGAPRAATDWPAAGSVSTQIDLGAVVEARADVRAALARVQSAQAAVDNAQALTRSDITWGASMDHYPGTSTRLLELRLQMPLQANYSYQGEIARALANLNQARNALDRTRLAAQLELQGLQQALLTAEGRAQRYDSDILPRARRVAEGAELAHSKGAIPLVDLLDARRTLRATLIEAINARADYARARGSWLLRTQADTLLAAP
ncbi:TolC family protein [Curvibacter sp. RS43]|uniref:TolC family protein n=1 Tax=Curvibacter microcysteis TaxID=3026419 RepID=A0ABT5MDL3_9BURK|nr:MULTISPECIES: TolC family protein [unclassified Curvibacter]MDD0811085.1 TolC family protein [Curvibacter sp. RS43]MDD0813944.1 TolC family protein [Curvibacter sp. HBC28]